MKQLIINDSNDGHTVVSFDDDLSPLSEEWETSLMLSTVMDRFIKYGNSKELIMKIIDDAYEIRLGMLNKNK